MEPFRSRNHPPTSICSLASESPKDQQQHIAPSLPSTQSILGPLLQPHAVPMLQQALRSGQARLNAELHRFYGTQRQASATAMGLREFHFALPMLVGLAEQIGRDASLKSDVKRLGTGGRLSRPSTLRSVGQFYIGQNFDKVNVWVYDIYGNNHTQISGRPLPAGSRNNREAVNIAIKMNQ